MAKFTHKRNRILAGVHEWLNLRSVLAFSAICIFTWTAILSAPMHTTVSSQISEIADGRPISPLAQRWRDCSHGIYIDVGTNIGVQIRKLYTPELFPGAKVLPVFDAYFGQERSQVCAVGFEPNSAHTKYLDTLNDVFRQRNLPAYIFTEVAVSSRRGNMTFYKDPSAPSRVHEWGASLAAWNPKNNGSSATVQLVDLHNFILDFVVPVARRDKRKMPPIIMKMDIEGAEYAVLPALIIRGALCHIDLIFAEWHGDAMRLKMPERANLTKEEMLNSFERLRQVDSECKVKFSDIDDETYVDGTEVPL
jgi:FkbM family methyltransferase